MERLVRIKTLEHQKPVVGCAIDVQELQAAGKAARQAKILFVFHELAVDRMLRPLPAILEVVVLGSEFFTQALKRRIDHRLPRVVFLTADEIPGAETAMLGRATILEVVHVVGDEVAMDARVPHDFWKRVVERLERPPAAVHEI